MNPARLTVARPVLTVMVTLIVILLGAVSLTRIPIDLLADITLPTLSITTAYENAGPEEVEELITRPLEQALSAVPGVEEVTSTSLEGSSNIRVRFAWGTDLDAASNDVRDRLDRVLGRLPDEADRPMLRKFDLAAFPIVIMGASSRLDTVQLRRIVEDQVAYRVERVPGVASLNVWGGIGREIRVALDAERVQALGLPLDRITAAIQSANVTLPAGSIERGNYELTIRTPGQLADLEELRDTVLDMRMGAPVRLRDVAQVEDGSERVRRIVRVNGEPGMMVAVNKQSGANTVDVARRVLREVDRINEDLPYLTLTPVVDTSDFIQRSIANVSTTAIYGGLFAVLVLLFFLRNVRSTVIIATAIPVSIVATFALVHFAGFTLNLMTLGGLALGIGMLVDNAIVVLESIYRRHEEGEARVAAALAGSGEVTAAVVASTLTTLAVFLPIVFVRGMAGVLFRQLAFVVGFALIGSLLVALTLVPMLSARFLRHGGGGSGRRLFAASERAFRAVEQGYRGLLHRALRRRPWVLVGAAALLGVSLALIPRVGTEFLPASDEGEVRVQVEMDVGTRLAVLDRVFARVEEITAAEVPERRNMIANFGGATWRGVGSHTGMLRLSLSPRRERERSSEDVAADLRRRLGDLPGARVRTRTAQGIGGPMRGFAADEGLEIEIRGYDLDTADALAARVLAVVADVDGVTDARLSREAGAAEFEIRVDRLRAADLHLTVAQVARALQTAIGGSRVGFFREAGTEVPIRVQVRDAERMAIEEVLDLTVSNARGDPVALRNVVAAGPRTGPSQIERKDQERVVRVFANTADRDLGSIVADLRARLRDIAVPEGFAVVVSGDYEEQQEAFRELTLSLVLALLLVYMVMASLYESLRHPFVVMFSIPLAAIGVVWMLYLTGTTLNVQSYVGCIMLGGIVVNNAILLVDQMNRLQREEGMELRAAIEEAGRRRLRPVLMTASTTIFALVPMALGLGEGGEAQAPLARAVIGGLASATPITLLVIPVMYSLIEPLGRRRRAARAAVQAQ